MTEEECLRNRLDMMTNGEIAKIIHDYIERDIGVEYYRRNYTKPPIHIKPVKVKTLKERLEEQKMKSTSTEIFHDIIAIDFELQTFPNPDVNDKFIVSATNRDDIFCFVFEGSHLADFCRKAGLFTNWEKDQKIRELEEKLNAWKKEAADCLRLRDEVRREKNEEIVKLKKENEELKKKNETLVRVNEKNIKRFDCLNRKFNRVMNENLLKTPITDTMLVDDYNRLVKENVELKKEISKLKNTAKEGDYIMYNGSPYTPSDIERLLTGIRQLEELKTPTIENFVDEEPSSRSDILDLAKKCVCGKREQDYGTPESNFQLIADLWNQYLFKEPGAKEVFGIGPMDVTMMMGLMKIARIRNGGGSGDSFVDLAGYAACGGEIWHSNQGTNTDSN